MAFGEIVGGFSADWLLYASMPLVAALIGYLTKRAAIWMMFRPLEFRGVPPLLGWQGVIPRNSERIASTAMDALLSELLRPTDLVARLDADALLDEAGPVLRREVRRAVEEFAAEQHPHLWEVMPSLAQHALVARVQARIPEMIRSLLAEVGADPERYVDLRELTIDRLGRDTAMLNALMREVGRAELAFIARAGAVFGFVLGLLQLAAWVLTRDPLVMPVFGAVVGWVTDWVALKMIFLPRRPKKILGLITWQGLFHKRQSDVARDYAQVLATRILTVDNVITAALEGRKAGEVRARVHDEVRRAIDAELFLAKPVVAVVAGPEKLQEFKASAADVVLSGAGRALASARNYVQVQLDIAGTVADRMSRLSAVEYEGILRPAFKQEEWKLIAIGALIGFLVGELQVALLLG